MLVCLRFEMFSASKEGGKGKGKGRWGGDLFIQFS